MHAFEWLMGESPGRALRAQYDSGALERALPEVHKLYGVPQPEAHHPEVDSGVHIELCLDAAARMNLSPAARFAVLNHDLGKGITDPATWPSHFDHESTGVPLVKEVCRRFDVPAEWARVALLVCKMHLQVHTSLSMRPQTILGMFDSTGIVGDLVLREDFLGACEADARGRLGREDANYPQGKYLREAAEAVVDLPNPGENDGSARWQAEHRIRISAVKGVREKYLAAQKSHAVVCE